MRVLEFHKRFEDPTTCAQVIWLTGDATRETVSCVNWKSRSFSKGTADELLHEFSGPNTSPPIIADVGLISSVSGVLICAGVGRTDENAKTHCDRGN